MFEAIRVLWLLVISFNLSNFLLGRFSLKVCMGYWPSVRSRWLDIAKFFFCVFMDWGEVEVHKLAKKEQGHYPAILTKQTWSIKDLLYGFWGNFSCGIQWVVPGRHLAHSNSQSYRTIWVILPTRRASHIIRVHKECHQVYI